MTWKRDLRNIRTVGAFTIVSEVRGPDTAHVIGFPDGTEVRILPDGTSGALRARKAREVTELVDSFYGRLGSPDALLIVFSGAAVEAGLTWEEIAG